MNFLAQNIHRLPLKSLMTKKVEISAHEPHIRVLRLTGYSASAILLDSEKISIWRDFNRDLCGVLPYKVFL